MDLALAGKRVVITGAGRGLGAACATGFAEEGAHVVAVARTETEVQALAEQHARIEPWVEDVTAPAFVERLAALDRVDVLVNNAGFNDPKPMEEVSVETLDGMLNLNVRSVYLASQAVLPAMRRHGGGAIVNMSSQMGHVGSPGRTVYCMTKHAVEGLTKAMAVELGPDGIRVNSVAPTFVETDLTRPMLAQPEFAEHVQRMIPMGRIGQQADVVHAVLFLASSAAAMTTGTSLLVDGGWTAH